MGRRADKLASAMVPPTCGDLTRDLAQERSPYSSPA
jgi:hypothetical protein